MLAFNTADMLFNKDTNQNYNSENNHAFLTETTLLKHMQNNDLFPRPYMVSSCKYDLLMGSIQHEHHYDMIYAIGII